MLAKSESKVRSKLEGSASVRGSVRGSQVPTHRQLICENKSGRKLSQPWGPAENKFWISGTVAANVESVSTNCSSFANTQNSTAVLNGLEALRILSFLADRLPSLELLKIDRFPPWVGTLPSGIKFPTWSPLCLLILSNNTRQSKLGFQDPMVVSKPLYQAVNQSAISEYCDAVNLTASS